jgi:hypothetical protein
LEKQHAEQDSSKGALQGPTEGSSKGASRSDLLKDLALHLEKGPAEGVSQCLTKMRSTEKCTQIKEIMLLEVCTDKGYREI